MNYAQMSQFSNHSSDLKPEQGHMCFQHFALARAAGSKARSLRWVSRIGAPQSCHLCVPMLEMRSSLWWSCEIKRYGRADGGPFYISDLVGNSTLYKFATFRFVNLGRVESGEERWDVVQALYGTRWISLTWDILRWIQCKNWCHFEVSQGGVPLTLRFSSFSAPKCARSENKKNSPPFPKQLAKLSLGQILVSNFVFFLGGGSPFQASRSRPSCVSSNRGHTHAELGLHSQLLKGAGHWPF